jgi:hypothetical protein
MMNTQRKTMLVIVAVVLVGGLFVQELDSEPSSFGNVAESTDLDETPHPVTGEGRSGPAIRSRPVSSAVQSDFEGGEPDDWDTLTSEQRIARTEDALNALRARIAGTSDIEVKQRLEEDALEVLSHARADYFLDPEDTGRYHELEASLGG